MEIKIVKIEAAPGAKIEKYEYLDRGRSGDVVRHKYRYAVIYHLENGETIETFDSETKLRDAKEEFAKLPTYPNNIRACFSDDTGKFWGTMHTYSIGGRS